MRGWVRSVRDQKGVAFITLNDGTTVGGTQLVVNADFSEKAALGTLPSITTGCSVAVTGTLQPSLGREQSHDVNVLSLSLLGRCDADSYPLAKKKHSLEYLRTIAHLRPRTNTLAALARVRSSLAASCHRFFEDRNFLLVDTPVITASDCEGAGEMFQVTTLPLSDVSKIPTLPAPPPPPPPEDLGERIREAGEAVRALKAAEPPDAAAVSAAVASLLALKALADPPPPPSPADFSKDFFGKPSFLTVSGQLSAETYACALGSVYTFGPTFRAENSQTSRHLAEFRMLEPEIAFADVHGAMDNAEGLVK
jgi:asparaginyl-tRNA synthetase